MKKLFMAISTFVLSFASLGVLAPEIVHAVAPYTCTWTGATNSNFSTAGNWSGCNSAAPQPGDGDHLIFDNSSLSGAATLNNDITGLTLSTIAFQGSGNANSFTVSGNAMSVSGGISDTTSPSGVAQNTISAPIAFTANQTISAAALDYLTLSGVLSGSGNLTFSGAGQVTLSGDNTFTGTVTTSTTLQLNSVTALGTSSAGTTVNTGGSVQYGVSQAQKAATIAEPFTFNTGATAGRGALEVDANCGFSPCGDSTLTLSGAIALGADLTVETDGTATITGALSGAHTVQLDSSSPGSLVVNSSANTSSTPNGTYGAGAGTTTTYSANDPTLNISVSNKNTAIVTGTVGTVTVDNGGLLKGTGTIQGETDIVTGGTIAPGMSPGCLTIGGALILNGNYQAELGGTTACSGYDQLIAAGTTDVTNGTLQVSLVNSFKPKAGDTFEIINNTGTSPITGTFTNLAEGATFTAGGYVYKITYKGGTGNDVVLTVVSVPATPNTGFAFITSQPLTVLAGAVLVGGAFLYTAKRGKFSFGRR